MSGLLQRQLHLRIWGIRWRRIGTQISLAAKAWSRVWKKKHVNTMTKCRISSGGGY
jgi:hypothetical protein